MQTGWRKIGNRFYNFGKNGKLCNGANGQSYAPHVTSIPGYYVSPMLANYNNTHSERVEAMIGTGMRYMGTRYQLRRAGAPGTSCDCSGLVMQALYGAGYDPAPVSPLHHRYTSESNNIWHNPHMQYVPYAQRQRGDLVFYGCNGHVYHVGIYLGNNRVLEALEPCVGIRGLFSSRPYIYNTLIGFKRAV